MTYSWDHIKSQVRQFRSNLHSIYPIQVWNITKDFTIHQNTLYFLSNNRDPTQITPTAQLQLHKINLTQFDTIQCCQPTGITVKDYLVSLQSCPILKKELAIPDLNLLPETDPLYRPSISSFELIDNTLLFTWREEHYIIPDITDKMIPHFIPSFGDRHDMKLGQEKIAFIRNRDIWITDLNGQETQLTFCSSNTHDPTRQCGTAEYMMQEEFHRLTGYYWRPHKPEFKEDCILYLETSELSVEQVFIPTSSVFSSSPLSPGTDAVPAIHTESIESMRYPRPGYPNATSDVCLVHFRVKDGKPLYLEHTTLWTYHQIKTQFPWMEYIVRFGWLPDGQSIWLQLLSRDQKQTALVKLVLTSHAIEILWQETNSSWINITDVYYFMQTLSSVHHVKLIWSSERVNGYRHLFLVEKYSHESNSRITQLTQGEWCCVDRPLFVDESRHLVYFSAKMHTPLESHFYVVSYDRPESPRLLTQLGFSHQVSMDSADYFIDCFSALHHPQVILIQKLNHTPISIEKSALLMPVSFKKQEPVYTRPPPSPPPSFRFEDAFLSPETQLLDYALIYNDRVHGEMFSFTTLDGTPLYGCLYKPRYYEPGKSYPTLLHIYGGPKTQLVLNEFKFPRLMRYLMSVYFNFAVVIIDSRGSSDRGLQFESHLQQRLGRVELKDQIEGLEFLHNTQFGAIQQEGEPLRPVIDMNRVAITGWSYGGYLSLMGLAQYPDVFKMAIAGAPVTQWELYDAAYTERYMGLPAENKEDYLHSSVLNYLDQFPNTEHRLLIVHGLIDENVHFRNTEQLVAQLDKLNKPYRLQVYPSEKHGLRHASVNEHFETLMYYWLSNYL